MKKFVIVLVSLFTTQAMAAEAEKSAVRPEGVEAGIFSGSAGSTFHPISLNVSDGSGKGLRAIVHVADHWKATAGISQQNFCINMAGVQLGCVGGTTLSATARWYPGDSTWKIQPYGGLGGYQTDYSSSAMGNGALAFSQKGSSASGAVAEVGAKIPLGERFYVDGNLRHYSSGQSFDLKTRVGSALITSGDISGVSAAMVSLGASF